MLLIETNLTQKGDTMKPTIFLLLLLTTLTLTGCSGAFWGGTATGALGSAGGYELNFEHQMRMLDDDLKAGKINQEEYNIRKDQIKRDSLLK